jgi:hypothetical protein
MKALALGALALTLAAPAGACIGDCNGDGHVSVDEIVLLVDTVLGTADPPCFSGLSEITDIIAAVNNALNGCETPTPTSTPLPTPTETPQGCPYVQVGFSTSANCLFQGVATTSCATVPVNIQAIIGTRALDTTGRRSDLILLIGPAFLFGGTHSPQSLEIFDIGYWSDYPDGALSLPESGTAVFSTNGSGLSVNVAADGSSLAVQGCPMVSFSGAFVSSTP